MITAIPRPLPAPVIQNLHDSSGIGLADTFDPQVPLQVRVGPYLGMGAGDVIQLFCDTQLVLTHTITSDEVIPDTATYIVLPLSQMFIGEPKIELHYIATRPGSGNSNTSLTTTVNVKRSMPGGTDTNPATPWQNERLALPAVFPPGVIASSENVHVKIPPYLNMFLGDQIKLSWNGELILTEIIDQSQVGKELIIPVPKEIIELAGDSDMLEVRYEVRDLVNNWSRWSLSHEVVVEADPSRLPAPVALQAQDMVLDLDKLDGTDPRMLVINEPQIQAGDELTLIMERSTVDGMALEPYRHSQTIEQTESFYQFLVPNIEFHAVAQGRVRLKYQVGKPDNTTLSSKSLPLKIIGQPMPLPLPKLPVAEENGGVLDPASADVLAKVPAYYFMAAGNEVSLVWLGKNAAGANIMHEELKTVTTEDVGSELDFLIPDDKVKVLAGGSVEVYYTVKAEKLPVFRSPSLTFSVSEGKREALPAPTILEAQDGILDPARALNGATVVIDARAHLHLNDCVQIWWRSQEDLKQEVVISPGDAGMALSVVFPHSLVVANTGSNVGVAYRVSHTNGLEEYSEWLEVSVKDTVGWPVLLPPKMDQVKDDGVLDIGDLPLIGGTVRVDAKRLKKGDRIGVVWRGLSTYRSAIIELQKQPELQFDVPLAVIHQSTGDRAWVGYEVTRGAATKSSAYLDITVKNSLRLDTSPVKLDGKVYLVPSHPDVLPGKMPAGTTVQRVASGGKPPYSYSSSDPEVLQVNSQGLATVRGNGHAHIIVTDAAGQRLEYEVDVSGVIQCLGLATNKYAEVSRQAASNGARLPTIQELRDIYRMWGAGWPLDRFSNHWSQSLAYALTPFGQTYYVKNMSRGFELDAYTFSKLPSIGLRRRSS